MKAGSFCAAALQRRYDVELISPTRMCHLSFVCVCVSVTERVLVCHTVWYRQPLLDDQIEAYCTWYQQVGLTRCVRVVDVSNHLTISLCRLYYSVIKRHHNLNHHTS
jgi:hypothetical protein